MKQLFISLMLLFHISLMAQDYTGIWQGKLGGMLNVDIEIKRDSTNSWKSYISVVEQGIKDLPAEETAVDEGKLKIELRKFSAQYVGELSHSDTIKGTWNQGAQVGLVLHRVKEKYVPKRPQTPVPPFSYDEEKFQFENQAAEVQLEGTLTLPKSGKVNKAVVMISGSGPSDRDESILNHKPFAVIADYLTSNGIAVLRYDDRGVGASGGIHSQATTMDLALDAKEAIDALRKHPRLSGAQIGIIGHSEGGTIAPMVNTMTSVDFVISLAGPAIKMDQLMTEQNYLVYQSMGLPDSLLAANKEYTSSLYKIVNTGKPMPELYSELLPLVHGYYESVPEAYRSLFAPSKETYYLSIVSSLSTPWMRYFITIDPTPYLKQLHCPILALNGSLDLQVVAQSNLEAIAMYCPQAEIHELPGLNHLFQHAETGSVQEYAQIEETFAPEVLEMMAQWINKLK